MNQLIQTIVQAGMLVWLILEVWIVARDNWRTANEVNKTERGRGVSVAIFVIAAFAIAKLADRFDFLPMPGRPEVPMLIGAPILWLGLGLRLWSVLSLGKFFRNSLMIQEDHHVVTSGPYKYLRHPSYSGFLLACIGLGIAMGNWLGLIAILILSLGAFYNRIVAEEQLLKQTLGSEYEEYSRRTKRLIPFIY